MARSAQDLMKMIEDKELIVEPLEKEQIQPASVDIRLGNTFSIVEDTSTGIINLENEIKWWEDYKSVKLIALYFFSNLGYNTINNLLNFFIWG